MIKSKHILSYCQLCRADIVRCVTCHNNCCNGGYGEDSIGKQCSDCPDAHDMQALYNKDSANVEFSIIETPTFIRESEVLVFGKSYGSN